MTSSMEKWDRETAPRLNLIRMHASQVRSEVLRILRLAEEIEDRPEFETWAQDEVDKCIDLLETSLERLKAVRGLLKEGRDEPAWTQPTADDGGDGKGSPRPRKRVAQGTPGNSE